MKILIIAVVFVVGGILGSARMGIISIPGITPQEPKVAKKQPAAQAKKPAGATGAGKTGDRAEAPPREPKPQDPKQLGPQEIPAASLGSDSGKGPPAKTPESQSAGAASQPAATPPRGPVATTNSVDPAAKVAASKKPDGANKLPGDPALAAVDPYAGEKKLAKVWAKIEAADIVKIVESWTDTDLAQQLYAMPAGQAGEILAGLKPARASKISKLVQKIAKDEAEKQAKAQTGA